MIGELGKPEIEHFDVAVPPQHDVLGFDVAVNDSRLMRRPKGARNLNGGPYRLQESHGRFR